jgi:hypothetical protein
MTAFLDLLTNACDHCYDRSIVLHLYYTQATVVLVLVRTITVNPRRTNSRNTMPPHAQLQITKLEHVLQYCSVQRIGGLTLADPIYVLVCILRRASKIVMVVMTIKTDNEYHSDDPRNRSRAC